MTTTVTSALNLCFDVRLRIIPVGSNLSFPLRYRRSEDFYLTSLVEFNCTESRSISFHWSIFNCSSSSCFQFFPIDRRLLSTMTTSEFDIPPRTFLYGIYGFRLILTVATTNVRRNQSVFVQIIPSDPRANLLPLGTSMITRGEGQDLQLNPGIYSEDEDENEFNAEDWTFDYFCRIYGVSNFPNLVGVLLSLDDSRVDPSNPSCLNNRSNREEKGDCSSFVYSSVNQSAVSWRFEGLPQSPRSSLRILRGSFLSNRTYQLMLTMKNKLDPSRQGTAFLLLRVEQRSSPLIAIG